MHLYSTAKRNGSAYDDCPCVNRGISVFVLLLTERPVMGKLCKMCMLLLSADQKAGKALTLMEIGVFLLCKVLTRSKG